ncbi:hypothetical protein HLV70_002698 [Listeria monocytogenes]|nr:hypothetical protein [Listeria monocytogenes]
MSFFIESESTVTSNKKPIPHALNKKIQLIATSFAQKGLMREKMAGIFCYNYSPKTSNILRQVIQDSTDSRCI